MKRNVRIYLKDICENMGKALRYVEGMTFEAFSLDDRTQYAVARCLEIVGEAAKNIPEPLRAKYPDVPWRKMAGMRDKIAHDYFNIQLKVLWRVVQEDFPGLLEKVEQVQGTTPEEM